MKYWLFWGGVIVVVAFEAFSRFTDYRLAYWQEQLAEKQRRSEFLEAELERIRAERRARWKEEHEAGPPPDA